MSILESLVPASIGRQLDDIASAHRTNLELYEPLTQTALMEYMLTIWYPL
jgi:hypothetical protein